MSALHPKADIAQHGRHVHFVPATDTFISNRLLRPLVRKESCHHNLIASQRYGRRFGFCRLTTFSRFRPAAAEENLFQRWCH
jgi:hypothetical protein